MTHLPLPRHPALLAAAMALVVAASMADATGQPIYRTVGSDGRVTFSDRELPVSNGTATVQAARPSTATSDPLPPALRAVQARFPVALYAANDCRPCDNARALLVARGIPFSEHTVQTEADVDALTTLSGQARLPFATIGRQHLKGFAADEWHQYLDAAGYPRTSALPSHYQPAPARPLVAAPPASPSQAAAPSSQAARRPREMTAPPALRTNPNNPAGLSF